ncbi:3-hydroxyisobutyrate dehydrogenase [Massilia sp. W12]|uniref:3-hydroxyisobutyrate dehydrogenase n=1 Tax=Massilia sp. W12 TaxID=3126507 RepID=UPI0030D4F53D
MRKLAFIGLGQMGLPMARNLCRAGFAVQAYDHNPAAGAELAALGAALAPTAAAALEGVQAVISMLPDNQAVHSLYLGTDGILPLLPAGSLILECSTIAPQLARQIAQAAQARGVTMLDAPVSGGVAGAAAATLSFMVGGDAASLARAAPLLAAMGRHTFHAGPHGAGQTAKLCNNHLLAILMAGTAEALALGVANGLQADVLSQIMSQSSGRNWVLEGYNPWPGVMPQAPAARGYSGGFASALMLKDLRLAAQLEQPSPTPLGSAAMALYQMHCQTGAGKLDFSSVLQRFAQAAGNTDVN